MNWYFLFRILIQLRTNPNRSAKARSSPLFSDLMKRWQGAADPLDNQLACEVRDIAMMRMIAAACLLAAPLPTRADDDFSRVKDSLSASHCFDGR